MNRIIDQEYPEPREGEFCRSWMRINGKNAVPGQRINEKAPNIGITPTKLDGTAKGGDRHT